MPNSGLGDLQEAARWLIETYSEHLAEAIESMTGERPQVNLTDFGQSTELVDDQSPVLWWEQPLTLAPEAAVWTGAPEPAWNTLGGLVLKAAGIEEAEASDIQQTYRELLQQTISALAQSLGSRVGREVTIAEGREITQPPSHPASALKVTCEGADPTVILAVFHPLLCEALEHDLKQEDDRLEDVKPVDTATGTPQMLPPQDSMTAIRSTTLDLLLDVELPVSISFGRSHLPLKNVLKLTSGSIVELNRTVNEPVEIIVNNCVIARGEVVVVDGNYGVRINQIISREQRLRTLN